MTGSINHCWRRRMAKSARYANVFLQHAHRDLLRSFFVSTTKAHFCSGMRKREPIIRSGSEHNSKHCIKKAACHFCCSCVNTLKLSLLLWRCNGKCVWIPCLLASEAQAWHHLFQRQPMGAQHMELPEDWARRCLWAASHPSVWFVSGTDQNRRRSTHGKDLRAES